MAHPNSQKFQEFLPFQATAEKPRGEKKMKKPIKRSNKTSAKTKKLLQENRTLSEKLEKAISGVKSIGPTIKEDMKKLSKKGEALRSSIAEKAKKLVVKKGGRQTHQVDPFQETNQRLHDLIQYFEEINQVFLQVTELTRNMNDTIIQISNDARESSRKSFAIATAALVVSATSLTMSAVLSYWNYQSAQGNQALYETFVGHVEEMKKSQNQQNEKIIGILESFGKVASEKNNPSQETDD